MPIKKTITNIGVIFGTCTEENRDKSLDSEKTKVISPREPFKIDYETFEYFIESLQKKKQFIDEQTNNYLGSALRDLISETDTPFYTLLDILFPEYVKDDIFTFVYDKEILYWDKNYFDDKYGENDTHIIEKEDYKFAHKITAIKELYKYIYDN